MRSAAWRWIRKNLCLTCALACFAAPRLADASTYHGQITSGGLPVPGATITATQGDKKVSTVSDQGGLFNLPGLPDGPWKIKIEMQCFSTIDSDVTIAPNTPAATWQLKMLPVDQILALTKLKRIPIAPHVTCRSDCGDGKQTAPIELD